MIFQSVKSGGETKLDSDVTEKDSIEAVIRNKLLKSEKIFYGRHLYSSISKFSWYAPEIVLRGKSVCLASPIDFSLDIKPS